MARALFGLLLLLAFAGPASAQVEHAPKVQARLIAERGEIAPGQSVTLALEENIAPDWHTYWINPGDAGAPTEIAWTLPVGWHAGAIQWPYPKRLPVGPLMNYGYDGKVWLLVNVTAPGDAKPGIVTLKADASWIVCKDVCIPEDANVSVPLTVSAAPAPAYATIADQFAAARAKIPSASPWPAHYRSGAALDLYLAAPSLAAAHPTSVEFFPYTNDLVSGPASQKLALAEGGIGLRMVPGPKLKGALSGVLVLTSADGSVSALDVKAMPGAVPDLHVSDGSELGIALAVLFALLGGLILNLMPCVLPILAMKALAVASKAGADRSEAAREGLAYGAGAVLSFVALGAAVIALRASGEAVGWGFQLQEPIAVAVFALLIFAVGLNLSGVFEIPSGITGGDALTRRGGAAGAFFTGVLAVAVAAPCTAPFMAAALGYALTQSTGLALLVFLALGIGFAAPFVAIGLSPALLRLLPKPGAWMLRFKQVLAFPMYGAAAWLVWVLAQESGSQGLMAALAAAVALAFAAWAWGASRDARPRWRTIGMVAALLGLIAALALLPLVETGTPASAASSASAIPSEPYTQVRLTELRAQNRPVFINATAAWCITCQVNESVAFSGSRVREAFARKHIAYLIADWTNRNAEITALLEAHGRSGVPLYLYYAPGAGDGTVLPQILTEDEVLKAIGD
ncbi:MAG TPA: protein-disulfide reductase DsbD domain-containing protein [Rhizomicrobium sp.]|nr:protein-disulfide reductase DsbD domain-containing protein [Rhizomicrobium sp.]